MLDSPDRFIVEQYTGFKDQNGKKIHEGDIIKHDEENDLIGDSMFCGVYGEVLWSEDMWRIRPLNPPRFYINRPIEIDYLVRLTEFNPYLSEVIGNVHENLELVGDKK